MDLFPLTFYEGFEVRFNGPGKARFVLQPLMATALGIRDGIADAKQGEPPYFIRVLFKSKEPKLDALKAGLKGMAVPLAVGVVLDMILQWVIIETVSLIPALIVGTILVALPYSIARGLSNRIARQWYDRTSVRGVSARAAAGR